jgi:hypothetical protein
MLSQFHYKSGWPATSADPSVFSRPALGFRAPAFTGKQAKYSPENDVRSYLRPPEDPLQKIIMITSP